MDIFALLKKLRRLSGRVEIICYNEGKVKEMYEDKYNNRYDFGPDDPDVYYDLVNTKMLANGLIEQDLF